MQETSLNRVVEVDADELLLDVRARAEFFLDHIAGARNVPVESLAARLGELGPKDRKIVIYCRSGRRSAVAARILREAGFRRVEDAGGIEQCRRRTG